MNKIKTNLTVIIVISLITAIFAFISESRKPTINTGSITVSVFQNKTVNNSQYAFQNYYLWQSNNLYLDNIDNAISSPSNIKTIFNSANLPLPNNFIIDNFSKVFGFKKKTGGGSSAIISYKDVEVNNIKTVLKSTSDFLTNEIKKNKDTNLIPSEVNLIISDQVIAQEESKTLFVTLVGLLAGAILGIIIVLFKEYTK